MSTSSTNKDKQVLVCQKQNGCLTHGTNCSPDGKLYCKKANNGFWLDNMIAKPCLNQKGCNTHNKDFFCVNQKYSYCASPKTGYNVINGIASEKSCIMSDSKFNQNNKNIGQTCVNMFLSHGNSCKPSCNSGYTLSKPTQCLLGVLNEGTCIHIILQKKKKKELEECF